MLDWQFCKETGCESFLIPSLCCSRNWSLIENSANHSTLLPHSYSNYFTIALSLCVYRWHFTTIKHEEWKNAFAPSPGRRRINTFNKIWNITKGLVYENPYLCIIYSNNMCLLRLINVMRVRNKLLTRATKRWIRMKKSKNNCFSFWENYMKMNSNNRS